jgi:hypothetical protein
MLTWRRVSFNGAQIFCKHSLKEYVRSLGFSTVPVTYTVSVSTRVKLRMALLKRAIRACSEGATGGGLEETGAVEGSVECEKCRSHQEGWYDSRSQRLHSGLGLLMAFQTATGHRVTERTLWPTCGFLARHFLVSTGSRRVLAEHT